MKKKLFLLIVFFGLLVCTSFAETSFKAEVDKTSLTTDQVLTYKVSITSTEKLLPLPKFPELADFQILSQVQSSNLSFAEGGPKASLTYVLMLSPKNTGKLKIGPATLKINDQVISTQGFEIEVSQGKAKPSLPESTEPQVTL